MGADKPKALNKALVNYISNKQCQYWSTYYWVDDTLSLWTKSYSTTLCLSKVKKYFYTAMSFLDTYVTIWFYIYFSNCPPSLKHLFKEMLYAIGIYNVIYLYERQKPQTHDQKHMSKYRNKNTCTLPRNNKGQWQLKCFNKCRKTKMSNTDFIYFILKR